MPHDAKLGLLVGVGLVIAAGVVFASKEAPMPNSPSAVLVADPVPKAGRAGIKGGQPKAPVKAKVAQPPRSYRPEYEVVSQEQLPR